MARHARTGRRRRPRAALPGDTTVDVAIVGAGFTGLWTAYSLIERDPSLRVAVLERETASFGASGRNGGWCVGDQAAPLSTLERAGGKGAAARMVRGSKAASTSSAPWSPPKGSTAASSSAVLSSSRRTVRSSSACRIVPPSTNATDSTGPTRCGTRREPVRLCARRGPSARCTPRTRPRSTRRRARHRRAAERRAATVYEHTTVTGIAPGHVTTTYGTVRADVIVRRLRRTHAHSRAKVGRRSPSATS